MQLLRAVLRRRLPLHQPLLAARRPQTGGPHKEYFQNPEQAPLPDTTPYNPNEPIRTFPKAERSWTARALRSVLWAALFGVLGAGAGVGLITWDYLQPGFEAGSPEDVELFEEITDTIETHPVAQDMRTEGWIEENFYTVATSPAAANLVHSKLTGTRGLSVKAFRHPTSQCTILLFFAGFGMEGWPDVIHGGVAASLMLEGAQRHLNNYFHAPGYGPIELDAQISANVKMNIDYKKPLRTGEVYAVVVPPAASEHTTSSTSETIPTLKVVTLIMRLETAPRIRSSFDAVTNTETHTLDIATTGSADVTYSIGTTSITFPPVPLEEVRANKAIDMSASWLSAKETDTTSSDG